LVSNGRGTNSIFDGESANIIVQLSGGTQPWKLTWPGGNNLNITGTEPYDFTFNTGPLSSATSYGSSDIVLSDSNNCTGSIVGSAEITIDVENVINHGLIIPEVFTPNEDGWNDQFKILGLESYPGNKLRIFNINGIEVYSAVDYDNTWTGTNTAGYGTDNQLPSGTYYYVLHFQEGENPLKGFVYIRRK